MNNEINIDSVVEELDYINKIYKRHTGFSAEIDAVKSRHQEEENEIISATQEKMRIYEKKRRMESNASIPMINKAFYNPIPELPGVLSSTNHLKTIILSSASGLAFPLGLVLSILFVDLAHIFGILILAGPFFWFVAGRSVVEDYLNWQKKIKEYIIQMKEWECEYNKLDPNENNDKLMADFVVYDKEFSSIVKDCDSKFSELFQEMTKEKNKLSKQHIAELEELDQEWKEIRNQLNAVTLIHSDLFYIAWRISSALKKGRAATLKEAINIAINDERLAQEEAARQAEARRQEAILQRQADDAARRYQEEKRFREKQESERKREAEKAREEQDRREKAEADRAKSEAKSRCHWCKNYHGCGLRHNPPQMCSGFVPNSTHQI